mmetsp:Transcript_83779/g.175260  ORF Transcript_83779/g.175260 Transcript_83779/m.175260 type:complete len:242 (-) Transcript_83779:484-1209(-)
MRTPLLCLPSASTRHAFGGISTAGPRLAGKPFAIRGEMMESNHPPRSSVTSGGLTAASSSLVSGVATRPRNRCWSWVCSDLTASCETFSIISRLCGLPGSGRVQSKSSSSPDHSTKKSWPTRLASCSNSAPRPGPPLAPPLAPAPGLAGKRSCCWRQRSQRCTKSSPHLSIRASANLPSPSVFRSKASHKWCKSAASCCCADEDGGAPLVAPDSMRCLKKSRMSFPITWPDKQGCCCCACC